MYIKFFTYHCVQKDWKSWSGDFNKAELHKEAKFENLKNHQKHVFFYIFELFQIHFNFGWILVQEQFNL